MAVTDLVLLDIKEINDERHKIVTSHTNKTILACAKYLSDIGKPVWIRHVLVPGLTDRDDDLIELGKFVKTLKNVDKFEILPYHTMGEFKWRYSVQVGGCETTDKRTGSKCKRFDGNRKLPRLPETGQRIKSIDSWSLQLSFLLKCTTIPFL